MGSRSPFLPTTEEFLLSLEVYSGTGAIVLMYMYSYVTRVLRETISALVHYITVQYTVYEYPVRAYTRTQQNMTSYSGTIEISTVRPHVESFNGFFSLGNEVYLRPSPKSLRA